jgi:hypothetical protein
MLTPSEPVRRTVLYPYAQWYFFAAIVITWIGFSQSYFMRLRQTDLAHHIHGACMGGWIVLLLIEPILYQRGKLAWHRKLGKWGAYGFVPVICVSAMVMIHHELGPGSPFPPGVAYALGALDLYSVVLFPAFVFLAVYYAKQLQLHARYMVCTVVVILPPALGRALFMTPWIHTFPQMLNTAYLLMVLVLLVLVVDDWRKGKVRAPYVVGIASYVPMLVLANYSAQWPLWKRLADWYGGL